MFYNFLSDMNRRHILLMKHIYIIHKLIKHINLNTSVNLNSM